MTEPAAHDASSALTAAFERLLAPLAQLMVEQGVPYARFDEMMRVALVRAAHAAHPGLPEHRRASRVSAATGLHRREVQRLLEVAQAPRSTQSTPRSPALEVFAHWLSNPGYLAKDAPGGGKPLPLPLPRTGSAPSFQSLAQEITRDMHPRALLEELIRLKLVHLDEAQDTVIPAPELSHAPRGDTAAMLRYLGLNVGDHLQASVSNVLGRRSDHMEQALAADGLSEASLQRVRAALRQQWQAVTQAMVPMVEECIEADAAGGDGEPRYRLRVGLYGYDTAPDTRKEAT